MADPITLTMAMAVLDRTLTIADAIGKFNQLTASGRMDEAIEASKYAHIADVLAEIRDAVKSNGQLQQADLLAIFKASADARARCADKKKLELIKRMTVGACRKEAYEEGMHLFYMELLRDLPTPVLEFLRRHATVGDVAIASDSSDGFVAALAYDKRLVLCSVEPGRWSRNTNVGIRISDAGRGLLKAAYGEALSGEV